MATIIQHRRGTAAQWASENPTLAEGELGLITDTGRYKIGDGTTAWSSLAYPATNPNLALTTLEGVSEPSAPDANELHFYAKDVAGRMLPKIKGPSGLDTPLQPAIYGNGIYLVAPGTTTAMNVIGGPAITAVGTVSHPTLSTSSLRQQTSRANVLSAALTNSAADIRSTTARVWRGDQAGLGGFFFSMRFSIVSTTALQRSFFGLSSSVAALATTQDPVALTQCVGVGNASADTNLQVLYNDGAGNCTKIDLGSSFPSQGVDDMYELVLFAPPNASFVKYRMRRFVTGAEAEGALTGAELPSTSQFLAPRAYMNNGGTVAAVNFDLARIYIETDY